MGFQLDPIYLLALIGAESGYGEYEQGRGPNPYAERWGRETGNARSAIIAKDWQSLQTIINRVWADISFGYSQRIVLYHELGNREKTWDNCVNVRYEVFYNPKADMLAAARRLINCFRHVSCNGTFISAVTVYNAGSDRRYDPAWLAVWKGNIASYEASLRWAETKRLGV